MNVKIVCGLCCCFSLWGSLVWAENEPQNIVRAKIGILLHSGGETRRAKIRERLKAGDEFRIYVVPEYETEQHTDYIYVMYKYQDAVWQLNTQVPLAEKDYRLRLPSATKFYKIDGNSNSIHITVICSPTQLTEIDHLFEAPNVLADKWERFEQELIEKSHITLSETSPKPFKTAGPLRDQEEEWYQKESEFINILNILSGNSLVLKRYEFTVKK